MITPEQRAEWARALGRLPSAKKEEFIDRAVVWLEHVRSMPYPNDDDLDVLRTIAARAEALAKSLAYADQLGLPSRYVRIAWRENGAPEDFPEGLAETLRRLADAARPEPARKRPAHRPRDLGPSTYAFLLFRNTFRRIFQMEPTFGTNSPFMKFMRVAFPAYGLAVPSPQKARNPL